MREGLCTKWTKFTDLRWLLVESRTDPVSCGILDEGARTCMIEF
jgi:hypothetical protein